ncbi:hypothetical protein BZA77DRAFT_348101 [Pyronema omphalodes]|nr:hypothetical protein BZA77DRAFT_348101 [Pyronema omphalodes]
MDGFTVSTGVAGFLSLALEITKTLKAYVNDVKSAPKESRNLLAEVTALCHILERLEQFLRKEYTGNFEKTSALFVAIEACRDQITEIYNKVKKIEFLERLKWPFRKEDYERTISTVQRFTQTFQFSLNIENCKLLAKTSEVVLIELKAKEDQLQKALQNHRSVQSGIEALLTASKDQSDVLGVMTKMLQQGQETQKDILAATKNTNRITNGCLLKRFLHFGYFKLMDSADQEMEALLQWISPLETQKMHEDVRSRRHPNTGNWFLDSEIFRTWRDAPHGVGIFGCYGIPGAGKTFISVTGDETCVAFIYCDYCNRNVQTATNMIGELLKQAITASKKSSRDTIQRLLKKKKEGFEKTYICIDALDECNEADRRQLIQYLVELSSPSDNDDDYPPIRLFFTGRPTMEQYVTSHASIAPTIPLTVKLEASTEDIAAYIAHKICEDHKFEMDDDLKNEIAEKIVSTSQGMFLLPALQIEAVLDQPTIRKRRDVLQKMSKELYDAFGVTLNRITDQKQTTANVAMNVLQWIFLASSQ